MKSKDDGVELVAIGTLRLGMFVELDVGWLAHPFPTGSSIVSFIIIMGRLNYPRLLLLHLTL